MGTVAQYNYSIDACSFALSAYGDVRSSSVLSISRRMS